MTDNLLTADIPEKFKDPETGEVRIDEFAKSYRELEKQFSQRPTAPKTPDEYCIECSHGLFEPDPDVNHRLHAKGFTQEQAQEVYNLAAEKMMPMIAQIMADVQADREVERLINHFGGAEQWKTVSQQILAFAKQSLPSDVMKNLSSSYDGVLALYKMMQSEEPTLNNDAAILSSNVDATNDLKSMMRDPKYWRDRDPSIIKKVTDGFKSVYGGSL
jgi:hypothetical protein